MIDWYAKDVADDEAQEADCHSFVLVVTNARGERSWFVPCFCDACGPTVARVYTNSAADGYECEQCGEEVRVYLYPKSKADLLERVADALFMSEHARKIAVCDEAAGNERPCPNRVSECPNCRAAALDAGIPLSVIEGKTKLTDHFSDAEIARNCGDKERAEALAQLELMDAGRGMLVSR